MALFGIGKKDESSGGNEMPQMPASQQGTPVDQVSSMMSRGMSSTQIVTALQQRGYSSQQIYDAMNQASVKGQIGPDTVQPVGAGENAPSGGPPTAAMPSDYSPPQRMPGIEETVESVVEEKWKDVEHAISGLKEWKDAADSRIARIEQFLTDIKSDMDNLHKAIVSKINDYDQNLLSVGTEIKAMEKVFSKVLPQFTENINELSRVTKNLKK